ncbi:4'-phosphopantetheinyl transferase superfamily protein [Campylobacter sp. FMV-PI01]|uniref:4'-phosphopantetheinyl transferase superfamily protein n=1 Tax=Campylobacter portucalensis TaxID=2608384 RepID=A0A6L5WID8_9BACT|nr:4'-phosphopantetheinyl transferase superfamily protein [Campylobacter portucalensis]MSN96696.1 4'-phosphopantetheinyl transferase superfamily protein [Campylobacter portucalensis]
MKNQIYLYFGNKTDKISFKNLDRRDKRRVKKSPNLIKNPSFLSSRWLKFKLKKRDIFISHKSKFSVIGISKKKIGIDMEELKSRNFNSIVEFCFTQEEKNFFYDCDDKILTFYKIFTTKEAILKYKNLNFSDFKKVSYFDNDIYKFHIKKFNFLITVVF